MVQAVETLRTREPGGPSGSAHAYADRLEEAVSDDLATPRALPILDELLADKRVAPADRVAALDDFDAVLGLDLATISREDMRIRPVTATIDEDAIAARLADRRDARAARDFGRSDAIRDELAAAGVEVMDGDSLGWDWKIAL
jgi:cysteinyl-tRNA synthetase